MSPQDDMEGLLEQFGKRLRERSDLANRVQARLESAAQPISRSALSWMRGLTMRQRITLGGIVTAAAVLLAVFLASDRSGKQLFAQAIEKTGEARTCTFELIITQMLSEEERALIKESMPDWDETGIVKYYWQAPGSVRWEVFASAKSEEPVEVTIRPWNKPGISIKHWEKTYEIHSSRTDPDSTSVTTFVRRLRRCPEEAVRELGRKQIGEGISEGFEVSHKDLFPPDPTVSPEHQPDTVEIWIDVESQFPTQIEMRSDKARNVMRNFKWDVELPRNVFDTVKPEGYASETYPEALTPLRYPAERTPSVTDSQIELIIRALKCYAKLSGGHYPKVQMLDGNAARHEMSEMAGIDLPRIRSNMAPRWYEDPLQREAAATWQGLVTITAIQHADLDAAYHGIDVGPDDADKVLLRWKHTNDTYQVIYGDLRTEVVTAKRLKRIE